MTGFPASASFTTLLAFLLAIGLLFVIVLPASPHVPGPSMYDWSSASDQSDVYDSSCSWSPLV